MPGDFISFFFVFGLMAIVMNIIIDSAAATKMKKIGTNQNAPALTTTSNVEDFPIDIQPPDFAWAVRHFVDVHQFQLGRSAPAVLRDRWWRIVDEDQKDNAFWLAIDYEELPNTIFSAISRQFELRMRVQWMEAKHPGITPPYVEVGWSCRLVPDPSGDLPVGDSPSATHIVGYSVDQLRLEMLAKARATNPNAQSAQTLQSHFAAAKHTTGSTPKFATRFVEPIVEKAYWPSPQDYNEAMQNPAANFSTAELKSGAADQNALGLPRAATGAFASVYKVHCNDRDFAVKCFLTLVHDQRERYEKISRSILNDDLDYTVDFAFLPDEILVRGKRFPVLRMDWVTGEPLNFWIEKRLNDPEALKQLAQNFVDMMVSLRHNGIAHGDLQHGNILVTAKGIRLVDYDGMFVPGMEGMVSNEIGHRNYQHPLRHAVHFGPWLDNFSAWVIYISLRVLAIHPELWTVGAAGDEALLFRQTDFAAPDQSALFTALTNHDDEFVRRASNALVATLQAKPDQVPYLDPS